MTEPQVIQIGGDTSPIAVDIIGGRFSHRLDALEDVSGADDGAAGQVLTKGTDGIWRPATLTGDGGGPVALSYTHTQAEPSTVWLLAHTLSFTPAGVEVIDHMGDRHYPQLSYPDVGLVRLDFLTPVRGTARLS